MRSVWSWCFLSAIVASAFGTVEAATYLQRKIIHEVGADGIVTEQFEYVVRLDSDADVDKWSSYAVYLNDNIELQSFDGSAVEPDGTSVRIDRKKHDEIAYPGISVLHSSDRYKVASFADPLPVVRSSEPGWLGHSHRSPMCCSWMNPRQASTSATRWKFWSCSERRPTTG